MAKVIRAVGTVVGVAVAAVGFVTGNPALVALGMKITTVANIAATAIDIISPPKGPTFNNDGSALRFQTNPQSGLPYCIGRTRMSGLKIAGATGASSGGAGTQDILFFAVLLAATPAHAIESFSADNVAVTFSGGAPTSSPYAGWMGQTVSLGELPQATALSLSLNGVAFPGWGASHKLSGMAHALWALRYDKDGNVYSGGVPEPAWIGKFGKCYDPRKDSTFPGGSGSHRANNAATWEWTRNPALHGLTWCLGHMANSKRVCGIGAPVASIRVDEFVAAANVADANGWTCGGVEWTTDSKWDILKRILQAGGAEPTQSGAMIGCRVRTPRVSIATITSADLLDELRAPMTKARRNRFNRVLPRFRSEAHDWQVITGSAVVVPDFVTADGGERTKGIDYPLVQDEVGQSGVDGAAQAGQLAAYDICDSREAGPITLTTGPRFLGLEPGDCVTLDAPEAGFSSQKIVIKDTSLDPATGKVTLVVETETDSKHAFALGESTTPPPPFTPSVPQFRPAVPGNASWSVTAISLADGQPGLRVAGTIDDPIADTVLVDYRPASGGAWRSAGTLSGAGTLTQDIGPLDGATGFVVRLAYRTRGTLGDYLEKASVTTNAAPPPPEDGAPGIATSLTVASVQVNTDPGGALKSGEAARIAGKFILNVGGVATTSGVTFSIPTQTLIPGLSIDSGGNYGSATSVVSFPAQVTVRAVYAGTTYDLPLTVTEARDAIPASGQTAAITALGTAASFVDGGTFDILVPNGLTLYVSANIVYEAAASPGDPYAPRMKITYQNLTDGGAETDFPVGLVDGPDADVAVAAYADIADSYTNSLGAAKSFRVKFKSRRSGTTSGLPANVSGTIYGELL